MSSAHYRHCQVGPHAPARHHQGPHRCLIRSVVGLAGELGIDLIAEGIEDDTTRSVLVELGCTVGQGYVFAPAMTLEDAMRWTP